jgi:hypothetical protein
MTAVPSLPVEQPLVPLALADVAVDSDGSHKCLGAWAILLLLAHHRMPLVGELPPLAFSSSLAQPQS